MISCSFIDWLFFFDAFLKVKLLVENAKKVREEELARMPGLTLEQNSKPEPTSASCLFWRSNVQCVRFPKKPRLWVPRSNSPKKRKKLWPFKKCSSCSTRGELQEKWIILHRSEQAWISASTCILPSTNTLTNRVVPETNPSNPNLVEHQVVKKVQIFTDQ